MDMWILTVFLLLDNGGMRLVEAKPYYSYSACMAEHNLRVQKPNQWTLCLYKTQKVFED